MIHGPDVTADNRLRPALFPAFPIIFPHPVRDSLQIHRNGCVFCREGHVSQTRAMNLSTSASRNDRGLPINYAMRLGGMLGMKVFHHKTQHRYFRVFFPVLLFIQIVVLMVGTYLLIRQVGISEFGEADYF